MDIRETKITRILNPTSIDLGEYVINPYKGCQTGCLYCYVRYNKVTRTDPRCWGDYVDVRTNAPQLLKKELLTKKPHRVLLGSTTECFQPIEANYKLTYKLIKILNSHKIYYSILTRSPLILDYISLLKEGYCESIYFTINIYSDKLKTLLEPKSASFQMRINTVNTLLEKGLPVIPYFSPLLPYISQTGDIFSRFQNADRIEFEGLNFNLGNINDITKCIGSIYPGLKQRYKRLTTNPNLYTTTWQSIKKDIIKQAIKSKKNHHIYIHGLNSYFKNRYRSSQLSDFYPSSPRRGEERGEGGDKL